MRKYLLFYITMFLLFFSFNCSSVAAAESVNELEPFYPEDGIYTIACSENQTLVLAPQSDHNTVGSNIQLCTKTSSPAQQFAIFKKFDGWYTIRNIQSQCNLDVANGSSEPYTNLQQWVAYDHEAQQFRFFKADKQNIFIQSKSGIFVDLFGNTTTANANILLYLFNGTPAQQWRLIPVKSSLTSVDIPDGNYYISPISSKKYNIDIQNPTKIAGSSLILNQTAQSKSQIYHIEKDNDGWYTIKNTCSHLYLDLKSTTVNSPSHICQWMGTGANSQKFKFYDAGNNTVLIKSKYEMFLSTSSDDVSSNTKIDLSFYNNSTNQKWILTSKH